jgi:hypothetical protein
MTFDGILPATLGLICRETTIRLFTDVVSLVKNGVDCGHRYNLRLWCRQWCSRCHAATRVVVNGVCGALRFLRECKVSVRELSVPLV